MLRPKSLLLGALAVILAPGAFALELRGPTLGAASNFSQTWAPGPLSGAADIGISEYRDEILWQYIEQDDGRLVFRSRREAYPSILTARDASMTFLVYTGHPNWEDGRLPLTDEGRAAFADYTARIVDRFPLIHSVEVGNEFNADFFREAEDWPEDFEARAAAYIALLKATKEAVHAVNPDIRFLGGAAHSIPIAWVEPLMRQGAAKHMDAFVIHPYTTEPEQLARQISLMRQVPGMEEMPLEVTEFGTTNADIAAGYLLRMYCQMALSGVTGAVWYPFSHRGDGLIPLLEDDGSATDVGETYAFIHKTMENKPVFDAAPDPFTYACRFGEDTLVIWGAPRELTLIDPSAQVFDVTGRPQTAPFQLSRAAPLVIRTEGARIADGTTFTLGAQRVVADSFDQFSYSDAAPFTRHVLHRGEEQPMQTRPGQETNGVPWTPYLGFDPDGTVRAGSDWASPSAWGPDDPLAVVHRYTATAPQRVSVVIQAAPDAGSTDGVTIKTVLNGKLLDAQIVTEDQKINLNGISLAAGDQLDVQLGPNMTPEGDWTQLRITILDAL